MSIDHRQSAEGTTLPANSLRGDTSPGRETGIPLHESELKYQRLVEGISGDYFIYTHDAEGVITYVSPSIENVLGFPAKAVLGLNWRDLIGEHFVGRELADRVRDEVGKGKKFHHFTVEISHADGNTRLVEIQQRPLFDTLDHYTSMEGIAKDITEATRSANELQRLKQELEQRVAERTTELIRTNRQLRKSEARFRSVVEHQTEFVMRWMPGAVFTFVNDAYCKLLNRSSEDLIGWCFLPTLHPEDQADFQEMLSKLDKENPFADFENRVILPDGSMRWTHWTNIMLFDEGGKFLEYQSVGRDITELKNAADTIREKEAHLAHISRLATMGELVAGMAHEIHQPLHAAKTFSEAARRNLEMGAPKNIETAIDCTKEISKAISRTAKIIRRLREFTHSPAVAFKRLNLNIVVREATELITFETRKAEVKLHFDLSKDMPEIQGDRIQLEQACVNLLINAYEALSELPAAERQVSITTRFDLHHVRVAFCDTGCGVVTEDTDILFGAFYSTKPEGMGMGLSLCKSIAEVHGGRIWGEQNKGSGMTFVLELPTVLRPPSEISVINQQPPVEPVV